jgi:uncharacterized protein DUF4440
MHRTSNLPLLMLVMVVGTAIVLGQSAEKPATSRESTSTEDFATAIKKIRDTWVQEFNAGHADKVADLYAPEAVLMRRNGSVHNRDSILAELKRSILVQARNSPSRVCTRNIPETLATTLESTTKIFLTMLPKATTSWW